MHQQRGKQLTRDDGDEGALVEAAIDDHLDLQEYQAISDNIRSVSNRKTSFNPVNERQQGAAPAWRQQQRETHAPHVRIAVQPRKMRVARHQAINGRRHNRLWRIDKGFCGHSCAAAVLAHPPRQSKEKPSASCFRIAPKEAAIESWARSIEAALGGPAWRQRNLQCAAEASPFLTAT